MATTRNDDLIPSHRNQPYSYPDARTPERDITEEAVYQHIGPKWKISVSETGATGTLTLILADLAQTVKATTPVEFVVNGTTVAPTTHPALGVSGTYTYTFTKDPKHNTIVSPIIHLTDGTDIKPGSETFDIDTAADVENITVTIVGNTATVTVQFDTDTATGSTDGQYSFNAGSTWTDFAVASDKTGAFTKSLSGSDQPFLVRGKDSTGTGGPAKASNIPGNGMSIITFVQISSTEVIITWSGVNVTLSIDGATATSAPPDDDPIQAGTQLTVTRDSSDHAYAFFSTVNGQTTTSVVHIPALGSTGGSGGEFSSLTNVVHDYTANTIDLGWAWSGDPTAAFNVYVSEGGAPYTHVGSIPTTASGATTYRYTTTADIQNVISPTIDIGFYVEAVIGSTIGPRSVPCVTSYGD